MSEWSDKTPGGAAQFVGRAEKLKDARAWALGHASRTLPVDEGWELWDETISYFEGNGYDSREEVVCSLAYARGDALDQLRHQATIARANAG